MVVDPSANEPNKALGLGEDDAIDGSLPAQFSDQPGVGPVQLLAATGPHVLVQRVDGGGIDLLNLGSAEVRQDVPVDGAAIVGDGDGRDRPDLLTPAEPALDQLGDGPGRAPAMLATVHLLQEFGLDLLGFPVGPLGLSRDLAADPSFAAGERVAAGVDLHLQAVAALADHGSIPGWSVRCHRRRMTTE